MFCATFQGDQAQFENMEEKHPPAEQVTIITNLN
jgi:hypothetical protein